MTNVNLVRDKFLIVYYSLGGNTKEVARLIRERLVELGQECNILALPLEEFLNIETYTHVFIGSPTYGEGKTPKATLNLLRYLLKDNSFQLPTFSVFGTGDSQWPKYCRSVDEIEHHLSKQTEVVNTLKIEQYPISKQQKVKIQQYVDLAIGR